MKSFSISLSTSSFKARDLSGPWVLLFCLKEWTCGSMLSLWTAISGDIPHMSEWFHANTSKLALRKATNWFFNSGLNRDPIFNTRFGSFGFTATGVVSSAEVALSSSALASLGSISFCSPLCSPVHGPFFSCYKGGFRMRGRASTSFHESFFLASLSSVT